MTLALWLSTTALCVVVVLGCWFDSEWSGS